MTAETSTLERIRAAELAAARRIDQARADAGEIVTSAQRDATTTIEAARRRGRDEAKAHFDHELAAATQQASMISVDAQVASVESAFRAKLPDLVDAMVDLVLSEPADKEQ
jgi:vacuolar-type H+-ATPase subunit H